MSGSKITEIVSQTVAGIVEAEIAEHVTSDSLAYLSIDGLHAAAHGVNATPPSSEPRAFCDACFSGDYEVGVPAGPPPLPIVD